jgi:hypothetical protein
LKNVAKTKKQLKNGPSVVIQRPLPVIEKRDDTDYENITIWSWNVNGIRAIIKKNRIQEFFEKTKPMILCC